MPPTGEREFIAPTLIRVGSIAELHQEIFGPVLHVATFAAERIEAVIDEINATGYGLTFGVHTRINDRVQHLSERIRVGNIYVNRNQVGAIVGSQPFGGEGLSGTGPKAGGPLYLSRFVRTKPPPAVAEHWESPADIDALAERLRQPPPAPAPERMIMPGPTGESNRLTSLRARRCYAQDRGSIPPGNRCLRSIAPAGSPSVPTGRYRRRIYRACRGSAA